jgi:hypothetical protein
MSMSRNALVLALLASAAARADGTSTTLFDSHPFIRDGGSQDNSLYQQFAVSARGENSDLVQDLRVVARGWGRLTFGTSFDEHTTAADLDSFFVEGRVYKRHLLIRVGRQIATGGAVRATQLDGIAVDGLVSNGVGVQGWAGIPVQPRFSQSSGDFLGGGRAFWRQSFDSEVGASYVYALRKGYLARSDFALDGSWTPIRPVTVSGLAQWSLAESRLAEARLQALWQGVRKLQIVADISRTEPDLFIDRSSIFAVFSEESHNEAGAEAVWRPLQPLSVEGDYHWLNMTGGHGFRTGARGTYRTPYGGSYGAELRLLDQPDNGYTLARLFGIRKLPREITVTVDLDAYWLQRALNTTAKNAFVATLTGGWGFRPDWEAMLAGSFGTTPNFERRTEVIARVTYRFGLPAGMPGGFR